MSHTYEVEIKSLLGSKENANALVAHLKKHDPKLSVSAHEKQLNHYFTVPAGVDLGKALTHLIPAEKKEIFDRVVLEGKKPSVRTREANGTVILIIKASVGDDSSSNGVKRIEFESEVPTTLEKLDQALLGAGLTYQAKWSRERDQYTSGDMNVCIDKNAGYGYLAEFEKMSTDESALEATKKDLLAFMASVGALELPQDRLERMFAHYNAHWSEYYGTEKVFNIE
ncbi:MAG: CYTH domain-containing protein [Patescibacteria group bacterium]